MSKNSSKTSLAQRLILMAAALRVVNEIVDLLSKVVNYGRPFRKLRI